MTLTPLAYFDLLETFPESGCAVCNLLLRDADRFLNTLTYERVMSQEVHGQFRRSRGLCNLHGWQLTEYRNVLGVATLMDAALDEILNQFSQAPISANPVKGLSRLFSAHPNAEAISALTPTSECMVCAIQDENEIRYLQTLNDYLLDERLQAAYRASEGLCVTHVRGWLQITNDIERSHLIVTIQREHWQKLQSELREFMRKQDFNNIDESINTDEAISWLRTIARLSGERGAYGTSRKPQG